MKLHIFVVSYYVQQIFGEGEDKTLGPVLLQPSVNVAAETQEEAVALVKVADGFERTVTGVANGTQDVLVADAPAADSSEADSLKASLVAMGDHNVRLITVANDLSDRLSTLKSDNLALVAKLAAAEADLARATELLNQKPQPTPPQPVEPPPTPAQPA